MFIIPKNPECSAVAYAHAHPKHSAYIWGFAVWLCNPQRRTTLGTARCPSFRRWPQHRNNAAAAANSIYSVIQLTGEGNHHQERFSEISVIHLMWVIRAGSVVRYARSEITFTRRLSRACQCGRRMCGAVVGRHMHKSLQRAGARTHASMFCDTYCAQNSPRETRRTSALVRPTPPSRNSRPSE